MKTNDNLRLAFAEEAKNHFRYLAYAQRAEKDGNRSMAKLFRALAEAERIHAANYLAILNEIGDIEQNLSNAADKESYDVNQMYPSFVTQAEKDGHQRASVSFRAALMAERVHAALLSEAIEKPGRDRNGDYFVCSSCGFTSAGDIPEKCPLCSSSKERFIKVE